MRCEFRYGMLDLTKLQDIDVLLCPTDSLCSGSGGLDRAIHQAAGPGLAGALQGKQMPLGEVCFTPGYDLGVMAIAHAAVPWRGGAGDGKALEQCYCRVLGLTKELKEARTVAVVLMGTGQGGWSYEESMEALWKAVLAFHRARGSGYFGERSGLERLLIYYPPKAAKAVQPYEYRPCQAFFNAPDQWGLRGDPYLWYDLMEHFDQPTPMPLTLEEFIARLEQFFFQKTGHYLAGDTQLHVADYAHGGMTSGYISSFMAEIGIPLLCGTLMDQGLAHSPRAQLVLEVELRSSHRLRYRLRLPYEILPVLELLKEPEQAVREKLGEMVGTGG